VCIAVLPVAGLAFAPSPHTKADRRCEHAQVAAEDAQAPKGGKLPPPDISSFLRPAGLMETRYVRLLSSLCSQTYIMHRLTVRLACITSAQRPTVRPAAVLLVAAYVSC